MVGEQPTSALKTRNTCKISDRHGDGGDGNPSEAFLRTVVNVEHLHGEAKVENVGPRLDEFPSPLENLAGFVDFFLGTAGGLDDVTQAWEGIC